MTFCRNRSFAPLAAARTSLLRGSCILRHSLRIGFFVFAWSFAAITPAAQETKDSEPASPSAGAPTSALPDTPIYLFLNAPDELDALLARMQNPDLVLVDWARFQRLLQAKTNGEVVHNTQPLAPRRLLVSGRLEAAFADLRIDLTYHVDQNDTVRVPIRLDGAVITQAREGDRPLPLSTQPDGGWAVELTGQGEHQLVILLRQPVRVSGESRRLELAVPESASTEIQLEADPPIVDVRLGNGEVPLVPSESNGAITRVSALIPPRPRIDLRWKPRPMAVAESRPVLVATGELSLNVQPGVVRIRGTYELRAELGESSRVAAEVDPSWQGVTIATDTLELTLDDPRVERDPQHPNRYWLPIDVTQGTSQTVSVRARANLSDLAGQTWSCRGFPLLGTSAQTGYLAISAADGLLVTAVEERGLRVIDPRTELSASLRAQPSIALGYQVLEEPFQLTIQINQLAPWLRAESRTTLAPAESSIEVDAWLDFTGSRDRIPSVEIELPDLLSLERVGPDEVVESSELLQPADENPARAGRVLVVRLRDGAAAAGAFSLHLVGRCLLDANDQARVSLFRPRGVTYWSGIIALLDARGREASWQPTTEYVALESPAPIAWNWPDTRLDVRDQRTQWIRHESLTTPLRVQIRRWPTTVRSRSNLDVVFRPNRVEFRQEIELDVENGSVDRLDLELPENVGANWDVFGLDVARRELLAQDHPGPSRARLSLTRALAGRVSFRVRGSLPFDAPDPASGAREVILPEVRIVQSEPGPVRIRVAADPSLRIEPPGGGWVEPAVAGTLGDSGFPAVWTRSYDPPTSPQVLKVAGARITELPGTFASRLWLLTTVAQDGSVRVSAWFKLDRHPGEVVLVLPRGAEWTRAQVESSLIDEVEKLDERGAYRLSFPPADRNGPVLLLAQYNIPKRYAEDAGWGPTLARAAPVGHTLWEVRLSWTRSLLGVPDGWEDENEWYWDTFLWKRRPRVAFTPASSGQAASASSEVVPETSEDQRYLFSRVGTEATEVPWILERFHLVAVCSGIVLAAGILLSFVNPPWRWAFALAAAGSLTLVSWLHPSLIGQFLQAALFGLGLALAFYWLHRRRARRALPFAPGSSVRPASKPPGLAQAATPAAEAASNDSTVIRARTSTTREHITQPAPSSVHSATHGRSN